MRKESKICSYLSRAPGEHFPELITLLAELSAADEINTSFSHTAFDQYGDVSQRNISSLASAVLHFRNYFIVEVVLHTHDDPFHVVYSVDIDASTHHASPYWTFAFILYIERFGMVI